MATGHVTTPQIYDVHWVKMWDHCSSRWDVTQIQMLWCGSHKIFKSMMTSSNGNIFPVTGPLYGEFTGKRVYSPHKGKWRGALMFYLICAWINGWVNNREAGDLRRHRSHYDVIVMICVFHISHKNIARNSSVLKSWQFAMAETCEIWLGPINRCIYYARQTREIDQLLFHGSLEI